MRLETTRCQRRTMLFLSQSSWTNLQVGLLDLLESIVGVLQRLIQELEPCDLLLCVSCTEGHL